MKPHFFPNNNGARSLCVAFSETKQTKTHEFDRIHGPGVSFHFLFLYYPRPFSSVETLACSATISSLSWSMTGPTERSTYLASTSTSRFTCYAWFVPCRVSRRVASWCVVSWGGGWDWVGGAQHLICWVRRKRKEGKEDQSVRVLCPPPYLVPGLLLGKDDVLLRVGDEHDGEPALLWFGGVVCVPMMVHVCVCVRDGIPTSHGPPTHMT